MRSYVALAALLVVVAILGLPFVHVPAGRDQGIFATAGLMVNAGAVLYRDVFEVKQPLILLAYAWAFKAAGQATVEVINTLDHVFRLLAMPLFFVLGRRLAGPRVGLAATAWFGLVGLTVFGYYWHQSQAESFSGPLIAAAFYCALRGREAGSRGGWWTLAGFAVTAAAAFKATALAPAAVVVLMAIFGGTIGDTSQESTAPSWIRRVLRRLALGALGAGVVIAPLGAYFAVHGALADVFEVQVAFNRYHAWRYPLADIVRIQAAVFFIPWETPAGLIQTAAFLATVTFLWRGPSTARWLVVWYWLAWLTVPVQGKLWHYHYALLLPPQALLVGWLLFDTARSGAAKWIRLVAAVVVVGQLVGIARDVGTHYLDDIARYRGLVAARDYAGRERFRVPVQHYDPADIAGAGDWIRARANAGDTLFVFGLDQALNFASGLTPPTRYIYSYPLVAEMPGYDAERARHRASFMERVRAAPPRFLVVPAGPIDMVTQSAPWAQLRRFEAFFAWSLEHYAVATRIGAYAIFERKEPA